MLNREKILMIFVWALLVTVALPEWHLVALNLSFLGGYLIAAGYGRHLYVAPVLGVVYPLIWLGRLFENSPCKERADVWERNLVTFVKGRRHGDE